MESLDQCAEATDGSDLGDSDEPDVDRDRLGDVCVAADRLKKRAPSEFVDSASESSTSLCDTSGILETVFSSVLFSLSRSAEAVSNNECRAEVRDSTMGSIMYLLVP